MLLDGGRMPTVSMTCFNYRTGLHAYRYATLANVVGANVDDITPPQTLSQILTKDISILCGLAGPEGPTLTLTLARASPSSDPIHSLGTLTLTLTVTLTLTPNYDMRCEIGICLVRANPMRATGYRHTVWEREKSSRRSTLQTHRCCLQVTENLQGNGTIGVLCSDGAVFVRQVSAL